jgi:hypothetical protein
MPHFKDLLTGGIRNVADNSSLPVAKTPFLLKQLPHGHLEAGHLPR